MVKVGMKLGKRPTKRQPKEKSEVPLKEVVTGEEMQTPLLPGTGARRRHDGPRYQPTDWDDSLPYGGKVYLARRKKPDSWLCIMLQVVVVGGAVGLVYYAWYHADHFHYHVTKAYAHLGHSHAQATVGHKLLNGKGVEVNHTAAMEWFKKAADQGHPQAAYNVAIGHLQGHTTGLKPGDTYRPIKHAAPQELSEAVK